MARCPGKRAGLRQGGREALRDRSPTDGWDGGRAPTARRGHCGAPCLVADMGRRRRARQYLGTQESDLKEGIKGYEVAGLGAGLRLDTGKPPACVLAFRGLRKQGPSLLPGWTGFVGDP